MRNRIQDTSNKLEEINKKLNNIDRPEPLLEIIRETHKWLDSILSSDKNLFINEDIKKKIDKIHTKNLPQALAEAKKEIWKLKTQHTSELSRTKSKHAQLNKLEAQAWERQKITWGAPSFGTDSGSAKFKEAQKFYQKIQKITDKIRTESKLDKPSLAPGTSKSMTGINDVFFNWMDPDKYQLCDESGKKLEKTWDSYTTKMAMEGGWEQDVKISNIVMDTASSWKIDFNNLRFSPPNIDISKPINLSLNAIIENVPPEDINIICNKPLIINITDGTNTLDVTDTAKRAALLGELEAAPPVIAGSWAIKNSLFAHYDKHYKDIAKKEIFGIIEKNNPNFSALDDKQKDALRDQIQQISGGNLLDGILINPINPDGTPQPTNLTTNYDKFSAYISQKDLPKEFTRTEWIYKKYLANNTEELIKDFFQNSLDSFFSNNLNKATIDQVITAHTRFQNTLASSVIDNNIAGTIATWRNNLLQTFWKLAQPKDKNYLRFLTGSSWETGNQTVPVKGKPDFKYDSSLQIDSPQHLEASFTIDGKTHAFIWGTPSKIIKTILKKAKPTKWQADPIPSKVRAHMAMSTIKNLIKAAHKNDISLISRKSWVESEIVIDDNDNIAMKTYTNDGLVWATTPIFTEDAFNTTKDRNEIQNWLNTVMDYVEKTMNKVNKQYRHASERRRMGLRKSRLKTRLPWRKRHKPIRWRLCNRRHPFNFNMENPVEVPDSNWTTIQYHMWKRKVTTPEWLIIHKKDLWAILNTRRKWQKLESWEKWKKDKSRIFDWTERNIIMAAQKATIDQARKNWKIGRTSFRAYDPITQRMYILTKEWTFGYVEKNNIPRKRKGVNHWRIKKNKIPTSIIKIQEDSTEYKEMFKNPLIMARFLKGINRRLYRMW